MTVSGDYIHRDEVVQCQGVFAPQPTVATAEGQPADTGVSVGSAGSGQAERLGRVVECAPLDTPLSPRGAAYRVDPYAIHHGEVDHQAVVGHGGARETVAAAAYRNQKVVDTGEIDTTDYVGYPIAHGDQGGPLVHVSVP